MQKKSKISMFIIGLVIVLTSIGLSYAYWKTTVMGDKGNNVTSGCFNVEMINQKDEITLGSTFPITDAEGLKLKPFSFTLKNTCTIFAHYYNNMEMLEGTTLNSKFVAVRVNNEAINTLDTYKVANTTINTSTESRTIAEGYLGADEEVDYTVSFWMDEDATIDDDVMNKVFKSKIVINSEPGKYDPVSAGYDNLHDAILANEYQTTPEIAKTKIAAKQEVDLSQTAPRIKWLEKKGESTTIEVIKPSTSSINIDTVTSELNEDDTKIKVFSSYTFDSETGTYGVSSGAQIVDPTTLDYNNNTYYFSSESISYNASSGKLYSYYEYGGRTIYKINACTKSITNTVWNSISYESITYNFSVTILSEIEGESDLSDKGIYKAIDDYGTTYYYRGNIRNNNVYFAGFYWQIVRINGNNSVRLIYNGAVSNATGTSQYINNQKYPFNSSYSSVATSDYMYGNLSATNFDELHSNINSSQAKTIIDDWYKENINKYSNYVDNNVGFCGDRSIYEGDGVSTNVQTTYGSFGRFRNNAPIFTCSNINRDLYSVKTATIGNKALDYPVGLISYDELVFAGIDRYHTNNLSWVYSTDSYWTISPAFYYKNKMASYNWTLISLGRLDDWGLVTDYYGLRPVINLKSDVKITGGTGTANDPFVVDTNN